MLSNNYPKAVGLYDPANEHDACGVAMVATLKREAEHEIVQKALRALENMEHRGATGADPDTGDGAGILIRIPDEFFRGVVDFQLPEFGKYVAGLAFIEPGANVRSEIEKLAAEENLVILGWREVPVDSKTLGKTAISVMPKFEQLFVAGKNGEAGIVLDRMAFCLRKRIENSLPVYFSSLSSATIVYKGMLTTAQLSQFYPE